MKEVNKEILLMEALPRCLLLPQLIMLTLSSNKFSKGSHLWLEVLKSQKRMELFRNQLIWNNYFKQILLRNHNNYVTQKSKTTMTEVLDSSKWLITISLKSDLTMLPLPAPSTFLNMLHTREEINNLILKPKKNLNFML
jgi:hypothetical protein